MYEARSIATGAIVLLNASAALFAGAVLWLVSVLHVDDGVAARMSPADWWLGGAERVGLALVVAASLGLASAGLSWIASRALGDLPRLASRPLARITAAVALVGGVIGAIQFVVTRPVF
jgi:hypothetical protein